MKISISNFKSISKVQDFELKPMTLLAGVNSSGKTSLLQALLLLKQTFEGDSGSLLDIDGEYVKANELKDLIHQKDKSRRLQLGLEFEADEIINKDEYSVYDDAGRAISSISFYLIFSVNGSIHLDNLILYLWYEDGEDNGNFQIIASQRKKSFSITVTNPSMVSPGVKPNRKGAYTDYMLSFKNGFLPLFAEKTNAQGDTEVASLIIMKTLKTTLEHFFEKIYYVGPQRVKPVLSRSYDKMSFDKVGIDGEYTRFLLNEHKKDIVEGYNKELIEVVRLWIVDKMHLASDIIVSKDTNKRYRTTIKNDAGVNVDLCHMGFGLSQILPVVVQGLLVPVGGTLIVEDPDVHMHPNVQAMMVNFFSDLIRHGRRVIVETHSDHIVTRLRLLIAQGDILNKEEVNVCFVTNSEGHSEYMSLPLTEGGLFFGQLPEGFLDSQDRDFQDMIRARLARQKYGMGSNN